MIKNLLPHAITLIAHDGTKLELPACENPARCTEEDASTGLVAGIGDQHYLPIKYRRYGKTYNLPPIEESALFVVSLLVRQANPYREDLVSPGTLVRDEAGNITGCTSLIMNEIEYSDD